MGVNYLLDTHAFVWLSDPDQSRGKQVRATLSQSAETVYVSSVSAFELATKTRLGKLNASPLLDQWDRSITTMGAKPLPLTASHALLAGTLAWEHRDPFDRLLVAQALTDSLTFVTADRAILAADVATTVPWR